MSQFAKLFDVVKADAKSESGADEIKRSSKSVISDSKRKRQRQKTSAAEAASVRGKLPTNSFIDEESLNATIEKAAKVARTSRVSSPSPKEKIIGKSRNADYTQVLTYLRKDTHRAIKKFLIDDPQERNLSDLVEELLSDWIKQSKKS